MSKVLTASCVGGVVSVSGVPVPGVTLLSEGVASSTGILIVDEDRAYYVARTTPDVEELIGEIAGGLSLIVDLIMAVNLSLKGAASAPYPTFDADALMITGPAPNSLKSKLELLKEALK